MGFLTDWLSKKATTAEMDVITGKKQEMFYFKALALHIAKSYIANTISKCEFKVYKDGAPVKDELYYALNVSPNPNQNSSEFLGKLVNGLYDNPDGVLVVPHKNCLYIADSFTIEERPLKDNLFTNIQIEKQSIAKPYKASDVFYFKLGDENVTRLINGLYLTYGELFAAACSSYRKGNGQKYKLAMEQGRAGDAKFVEQFEGVIKKQLQAFIDNPDAVYPQFQGYDLQSIGGQPTGSADVIALRKEIFDVTAQSMKIPLPMMYGNITNLPEVVKVFLTICIDPLADFIGEEFTRKTNTFETWNGGRNCVRIDTTRINHIDILDVAEKADKLISCGMVCHDELREIADLQPVGEEWSKRYYITKNYAEVGSTTEQLGGEQG